MSFVFFLLLLRLLFFSTELRLFSRVQHCYVNYRRGVSAAVFDLVRFLVSGRRLYISFAPRLGPFSVRRRRFATDGTFCKRFFAKVEYEIITMDVRITMVMLRVMAFMTMTIKMTTTIMMMLWWRWRRRRRCYHYHNIIVIVIIFRRFLCNCNFLSINYNIYLRHIIAIIFVLSSCYDHYRRRILYDRSLIHSLIVDLEVAPTEK